MKIIFNSDGEMNKFIKRLCPSDVTFNHHNDTCDCYDDADKPDACETCWKNSPIEMEVAE